MKKIIFYFTLDTTFKEGVDYRSLKEQRNAGVNIDEYYYPKETGIYLSWSINGKYFKVAIGHNIKPAEWDYNKRCPLRKHKYFMELNTLLNKFKSACEKNYLHMRTNDLPINPDSVQQMVKASLNSYVVDSRRILEVYNEFLAEKEQLVKSSTITKYNSTMKSLKAFEKTNYELNFENIATMKFYTDFRVYSIGVLKHLNNTISKSIQNIKAFLQWCFDHSEHYIRSTEFKRFRCEGDYSEPIFLTIEEVRLMEKYNPEESKGLLLSKEIFLFLCYTGQRISDIIALRKRHIKIKSGSGMEWELYQEKGNKSRAVYIPIVESARIILEKYMDRAGADDYIFPRQSPVVTNRNLKKIGQAAGLTDATTKVNFSGKAKREICQPKYHFLTTHVGRKTFITLLKQHKFTDIEIQSISGHSSYKEMLPYIGVDRQAVKQGMEKMFG
ncbi:tyrosine-type recombinase/integrase [Flavipsychrobacter stenotrophus]|uniref:tyrosine-type recombinase/integrase n=1 Tax=Flavipsychrobacter stenotrophus TaxID=2077091 RepID=UPI00137520B3|nr:tyrosine-type recombinase/integrase [Flavipsychrobacter stenotrophus]